jgi:SAM-dependent methyltransferase
VSTSLLRRIFPSDLHHVAGLHAAIGQSAAESHRMLDLGCGANIDLAPYRSEQCEVWGSDFQAHPELKHSEWFRPLRSDGKIPFPDAHFDTIIAVMVLEHVEDPIAFFDEVARALRPGGRFIGHTISGLHYVTWLRRLCGLLPHSANQALVKRLYKRSEVDTFPTFYRSNTQSCLEGFFQDSGLTPVAFQRYADPGYFRFAKPLETAAILADRLFESIHAGCGRLYFTAIAEKPVSVKENRDASPQTAQSRRRSKSVTLVNRSSSQHLARMASALALL